MNWIDKPIEPTKRPRRRMGAYEALESQWQERDRLRRKQERELQARAKLECASGTQQRAWVDSHTPTSVLHDWHTDSTGCRARVVGNDG